MKMIICVLVFVTSYAGHSKEVSTECHMMKETSERKNPKSNLSFYKKNNNKARTSTRQ